MIHLFGWNWKFPTLTCIFLHFSNDTFSVVKEFPVNMLERFEEVSGHRAGPAIVLIMQYGQNFSGPNYDVFREDRAVGNADVAHKSNFLHPTLYYYQKLPKGKNHCNSSFSRHVQIDYLKPRIDKWRHMCHPRSCYLAETISCRGLC